MCSVQTLSSLSARDGCIDALHRVVIGLDDNDAALFKSGFTADGVMDMSAAQNVDMPGAPMGVDEAADELLRRVGHLVTTHMVTNVRVDVKSATEASASAFSLANHFRPGEGIDPTREGILHGNRYFVDCVRDPADGVWKIKHFKFTMVWQRGDKSVFEAKPL